MGQKVHPYGFRLGFNKTWRSRWFADKDYAKLLHEDLKLRDDLKKRFSHAGVSKVEIERAANKLKIDIHTSRPGGDAGRWRLTVDEEQIDLDAAADGSPYHARVGTGADAAIDRIRNGAVACLHPHDGAAVSAEAIPLGGSYAAIGAALYYCAPRVPPASSASGEH